MKESESEVPQSCPTLCDSMYCSLPGSPSMGFSRQEYWSGLPFPSPGDLPNPGIEAKSFVSPALAGGFFTNTPPGKPTPVFLPGKFHGQRSLVGYSPWGRKESDITEQLTLTCIIF